MKETTDCFAPLCKIVYDFGKIGKKISNLLESVNEEFFIGKASLKWDSKNAEITGDNSSLEFFDFSLRHSCQKKKIDYTVKYFTEG